MSTYFLTGCASGMGRHLAGVLLRQGDTVFATDVNFDGLKAAAEEWPSEGLTLRQLDVTSADAWREVFAEAVEKLGPIDVVMNIAGVLFPAWSADISDREIELTVDVNVKGLMYGTREAVRHMQPRKAGHIINLCSLSSIAAVPGLGVYSATKFAARAFTVACATELRDQGVYVTAICPDPVKTPMLDPQANSTASAMSFTAPRFLTVQDIEHAVFVRALKKKRMEVIIPRRRGWLGKWANLMPGIARWLWPWFQRRGEANQKKWVALHGKKSKTKTAESKAA